MLQFVMQMNSEIRDYLCLVSIKQYAEGLLLGCYPFTINALIQYTHTHAFSLSTV